MSYRMSQINTHRPPVNTHRPPVSRHVGAGGTAHQRPGITPSSGVFGGHGQRPGVGSPGRDRVVGVRNGGLGLTRNAFKRPSMVGTLHQAITNPNAGRSAAAALKSTNRLPSKLPNPIDENDGPGSVASYDDDSDESDHDSRRTSLDKPMPLPVVAPTPATPLTQSTSPAVSAATAVTATIPLTTSTETPRSSPVASPKNTSVAVAAPQSTSSTTAESSPTETPTAPVGTNSPTTGKDVTTTTSSNDSSSTDSSSSSPLSSREDGESDSSPPTAAASKNSRLAVPTAAAEAGEKDARGDSHQRQSSLSTRSSRRRSRDDSVSMSRGFSPESARKNLDEHDELSNAATTPDKSFPNSNNLGSGAGGGGGFGLKSASISGVLKSASVSSGGGNGKGGGNPLDNITHKSEPAMSTLARPSLFNGPASLLSLAKPPAAGNGGGLVTRSLNRDRGTGHDNFKMSPVFGHRYTSSRSSSRGSLQSPSGARRGGPMSSQYNTFSKQESDFDESQPHFDEFLSVDTHSPRDHDDDNASIYTTASTTDDELFSLDNCDFAGLSENHQFRSELRKIKAGTDILFSNMGDKINRKRKKQQRWFVVTDAAVINYTMQPSKINRVIPIEEISSISRSEDCEWFVVHHLSRESDYLIRCHQYKKFIAIVAQRYQEVMLQPLEILVGNEYLVFQKGKKALTVKITKKQQVNGLSYKTTNLVWKDRPSTLTIEMMLPRYQPPLSPSMSRNSSRHTASIGGGAMFAGVGQPDQPAGGGPGSTLFAYPSASASGNSAAVDEPSEAESAASSSMMGAPQAPSKSRMSKMERLLGNDGASASSNLGGGSIGALGRSAASPTFAPLVLPEDAAAAKKPKQPKPTRRLFGSYRGGGDKGDDSSSKPPRSRNSRSGSSSSTSSGTRKKSLASSFFSLNRDKDEDNAPPTRPASAGAGQGYSGQSPSLGRRSKWGGNSSANDNHRRSLPNVRQSPASAGSGTRKSPFSGGSGGSRSANASSVSVPDPYDAPQRPNVMPRSKSIGSSTLPPAGARRGPGNTMFGGNSLSSAPTSGGGPGSTLFGASSLNSPTSRSGPGASLFGGGNSMNSSPSSNGGGGGGGASSLFTSSPSSNGGGGASSLFNSSPASNPSSPFASTHKSPLTGNVKVRDAASSEFYGATSPVPNRPLGPPSAVGMGSMAFRYVTNNAILEEHHKRHKSMSRNSDSSGGSSAGGGLGSGGMLQDGSRVPSKGERGPFGQYTSSSASVEPRSPRKSSLGLSVEKPPSTMTTSSGGASGGSSPPVSTSPPTSFTRPRLSRPSESYAAMPHHPAHKVKSPTGRGAHSSKSSQSSISSFSSSSSSIDVNSDSDFGPGPIKRPSLMQAARRVGKAHHDH